MLGAHTGPNRYGAPREIPTDQGREFIGGFQTLLAKHGITHRLSSWEHPQPDRLAEVKKKRALRKCLLDGGGEEWDEFLPYIAMGYRMSKQKAVGSSPYFLIFGRDSVFESQLQQSHEEELDLNTTKEGPRAFLVVRLSSG